MSTSTYFLAGVFLVALLAYVMSGCSSLSDTQQRVLSGTAIGAGAGLLVGAPLIGAGVGAAGGYVYDKGTQNAKTE